MNPINRRGQKIICITEIELVKADETPIRGAVPKVGGVYTVEDFVDLSAFYLDPDAWPGITLVELPLTVRMKKTSALVAAGWPLVAFRPVDERETDISDIVRLGTTVRQTEDA